MIRSSYSYWQHLQGRRDYDSEQSQVSDIVIAFLETLYPGIGKDIEFVDEATPLSYERYTNNWMGSTSGWLLSRETLPMLIMGVSHTLPRLRDFYMAGQWTEPGGMVPLVAASARNVVQMMCHADGKHFAAQKPG
jgi:phytoene dehydrogenase-like protein